MKGTVTIQVLNQKGKVLRELKQHNYTFDILKNRIVESGVPGYIRYIGIGLDDTAGTPSDTPELKNMLREEECSRTKVDTFTIRSSHTFTYFDNTYEIKEVGLKLSNGEYLTRAVLSSPITVDENNNLRIIYDFEVE